MEITIDQLDVTLNVQDSALQALSAMVFLRSIKSTAELAYRPNNDDVVQYGNRVYVVAKTLNDHALLQEVKCSDGKWQDANSSEVVHVQHLKHIDVSDITDTTPSIGCLYQSLGNVTPSYPEVKEESTDKRFW